MSQHGGGNMHGEEQFNVVYDNNDSNSVKGEKKFVIIRDGGNMAFIGPDGEMIPPPPPMPGMHVRSFKMQGGDPFAMDPNDDDIITYDKKDIGKGLEKITIVRKKQPETDKSKEYKVQVDVNEETKK